MVGIKPGAVNGAVATAPMDECNNGPPPRPRKVWAFSHVGGWAKVPDPAPDADPDEDYDKARRQHGFAELTAWPTRDNTLWLQIFEGQGREDWLICFNSLFTAHTICVSDLPSYLDLLGRLLPLVEAGDRLDAIQERHENEREERRRERAGSQRKAVRS